MSKATIKIDPVHELVSLADRMLQTLIGFDSVDTPYYTKKLKRLAKQVKAEHLLSN